MIDKAATPDTVDPIAQLDRFRTAVDLLGGQRATAAAIAVTDRTIRALLAGEKPLHTGFLRDVAAALRDHARRCAALERALDPLFAANRTDTQLRERPDGRRHQPAQATVDAMTDRWREAAYAAGRDEAAASLLRRERPPVSEAGGE